MKEELGDRLVRLGVKTWETSIRSEGDVYILVWGDYFEPDPQIKKSFIEKHCIESGRFDNGYIATFTALLSQEQKDLIVSAYGEDVKSWKGVKTITTTTTRL